MSTSSKVSIVIGSYNRASFLRATIETVRSEVVGLPHEIIVVDGGSTDGTLDWLVQQKDIIAIVQHNRGVWRGRPIERRSWGYFMNLGFKAAQGKYILMLSDDSLLVPGGLKKGLDYFDKLLAQGRKIGAMAFYWRNWPEQSNYMVGLTLGDKMFVNHGLYLRDALAEVSWVDEETYRFYHGDGDVCLKMWQSGYEVVDSPESFIEHYMHAAKKVRSSNMEKQSKDWQAYLERWNGIFYSHEAQNIGGWLYLSYRDQTNTVRKFPFARVAALKMRFKSFLRPYWKKYVAR